jgi:hypothetical protein
MVEDDQLKRFSVCNLVESYNELFQQAIETTGNLEPFIQQLSHYDSRDIKEFEDAIQLAKDISVRSLLTGMMSAIPRKDLEKKLSMFLTPKQKKAHGRPIYHDEAVACGLNIRTLSVKEPNWQIVTALHHRLNGFVTKHASKCVETARESFSVPFARRRQ